jgi:hypothetical protein
MKFQILLLLVLLTFLVIQNRTSNFDESIDCAEYCTLPDADQEFCKIYCPGVSTVPSSPKPSPCAIEKVDCEYCGKPDANPECCKTVYCPLKNVSPVGPGVVETSPVAGIVESECVNLANPSEKLDMSACATNNGQIYFDILGSVNQRNYPMVGKDQGGIDSSSTLPPDVDDMNVIPVNKNTLGYQISGENFSSTSIVQEDTNLLNLTVPSWVVPEPGRV